MRVLKLLAAWMVVGSIWVGGNVFLVKVALDWVNLQQFGGQAEAWMAYQLGTLGVAGADLPWVMQAVWWGVAAAPSILQEFTRHEWRERGFGYASGALTIHGVDVGLSALGGLVFVGLAETAFAEPLLWLPALGVGVLTSVWAQNQTFDIGGELWRTLRGGWWRDHLKAARQERRRNRHMIPVEVEELS